MSTDTAIRPSEALELVALVMERWQNLKLTGDQQVRYAEDLAGLDAVAAGAAVEALHRTGRQFAPTAGEVRREAARLELGPPDWAEVKRSLIARSRALAEYEPPPWVCPYNECNGDGFAPHPTDALTVSNCRCRPERIAARRLADTLHPLVREFIGEGFVSWHEVNKLGEARGDGPTLTLEAQMRTKWEGFSARAVESRVIATIAPGSTLPRLEQAREEDAPRRAPSRSTLRPANPLAALPGLAPEP